MKKIILAVAIVAVLAMAFTSVGYAYTASTENSGNSVTSQYVTLTQQNYTFSTSGLSFDVIETEAGIKYQLVGTAVPLMSIEGADYMGISIGTDKLSASVAGWSGGLLDVAVSSSQLDGTWFTDYSGDLHGWRYVLKVTADYTATKTAAEIAGLSANTGDCYKISTGGDIGTLTVKTGDVVGYDGSVWVLLPDQYAYYNGSSNGMWIVKGQPIASQYRVAAADADAGGYIRLYSADTIKDVTVVVITHNNQGNPVVHHVYLNEGITEPINLGASPTGKWYVDGREILNGTYTVDSADTDGGCNVVIYDSPSPSVAQITDYTVVKIDNGTANLEYGKTAGQAIDGVSGWHVGGGIKFRILTGTMYSTQLFFAGEGKDVNSSLRTSGTTIKTSAHVTVTPEWVPAGDGDVLKYTLKSGLGTGADRVLYVTSGSKVMLPENCFTAPTGKVFVGWKADNLDKVFTSGHTYNSFTEERTFTAQWAEASNCWTISFNAGIGGVGSMASTYLIKNNDSGSTYTLPPCAFTNEGHEFIGWKVTGTSGRDYSDYTARFTDINGVKENLTLTAQWAEAKNGANVVSITFDTYTAVVVPHEGDPYVVSGLEMGDTITLAAGTWYVKGAAAVDAEGTAGFQYVLRASDIVTGGYVVLYQDKPSDNVSNPYRAIKVEGNSISVSGALAAGANVEGVGGWMVNGASIYGGLYKVKAADADSSLSRFIVAYEFTNATDEYTVIMVPSTGTPIMTKGLHTEEVIPYTGETWYVKGVAKANSYTVAPADAVNGFIVLCETNTYNADGEYAVIKAGTAGATVTKELEVGDRVADLKGWKVKGVTVGTYKIQAADATALGSDGFILIYSNMAATYVVYTGENGYYTVPYSISPPPADPGVLGFKGWKLMGWEVTGNPGRSAPQSYTMPYGTDGCIVKNGTIKFEYSNDLHNGEELA